MGRYHDLVHPIETGNVVLIFLGIGLILSGITIIFRTLKSVLKLKPKDIKELGSHLLNVLIAVIFVVAGGLFIVNNLRGNPLKFKAQTQSVLLTS